MHKITVGEKKGNKYKIYLDGNPFLLLNKETLLILKIHSNKIYSKEEIEKIKLYVKIEFAKKKALMLLNIRDYSEIELFNKLLKYVSKEIAKQTVLKIKKLGLINNYRYAENLAKKLIINKNKSKKFAFFELRKKGIDEQTAKKILTNLKYDPIKQLENLIVKQYLYKLKNLNSKKKLIASLLRMGHSYCNITKAMENINHYNHL